MLLEWNMTVAGCVLCIIFCWFLGILERWEGIQFGRIRFIVGCVGVIVLTGLAVSNPLHIPEFEGVHPMNNFEIETSLHVVEAGLANAKRLDLVTRTRNKLGGMPSKEHLPWEYPDGRLAWVTKDEYIKLRTEQRKGEK